MLQWRDWVPALRAIGVTAAPDELPLTSRSGLVVPGTRLRCALDGKRVELQFPGRTVAVRVPIDPALDLGLLVEPEGMLPRPKVHTGNRDFDALFTIVADEDDRAAQILTPPVVETLVALLGRSIELSLRDDAIALVGEGDVWLRMALPRAVEIAHRIDGRRSDVTVASELREHRADLGRFAADHALRIDDTPLRLAGTTKEVRLQVAFVREAQDRFVMLGSLLLGSSLDLDLHVAKASLLTPLRALLPGQTDHLVGDPAFDAAFHVRTSRPEVVARVFERESCRALERCGAAARALVLDDRGLNLEVETRPDSPSTADILRSGLDALVRLVTAVRRGPSAPPRGPFR